LNWNKNSQLLIFDIIYYDRKTTLNFLKNFVIHIYYIIFYCWPYFFKKMFLTKEMWSISWKKNRALILKKPDVHFRHSCLSRCKFYWCLLTEYLILYSWQLVLLQEYLVMYDYNFYKSHCQRYHFIHYSLSFCVWIWTFSDKILQLPKKNRI